MGGHPGNGEDQPPDPHSGAARSGDRRPGNGTTVMRRNLATGTVEPAWRHSGAEECAAVQGRRLLRVERGQGPLVERPLPPRKRRSPQPGGMTTCRRARRNRPSGWGNRAGSPLPGCDPVAGHLRVASDLAGQRRQGSRPRAAPLRSHILVPRRGESPRVRASLRASRHAMRRSVAFGRFIATFTRPTRPGVATTRTPSAA